MISDAQSKQIAGWAVAPASPRLTSVEKGLLAWAVLDQRDKVLDVTCKQGAVLETIQRRYDCEVCGTAETMDQLQGARQRLKNADIVYGQAEDVPWLDGAFDAVLFDATARSLQRSEKCLSEIKRVLKPGGQLVLASLRAPKLIKSLAGLVMDDEQDAGTMPTLPEILATIEDAGFSQTAWHQIDLTKGVLTCWKPMKTLE